MLAHVDQVMGTIWFFLSKPTTLRLFVNKLDLTSSEKRLFVLKEEIFDFRLMEMRFQFMPSPSVHHDYSIDLVKIRLFPEMHTD
jgi:hypothetical protein